MLSILFPLAVQFGAEVVHLGILPYSLTRRSRGNHPGITLVASNLWFSCSHDVSPSRRTRSVNRARVSFFRKEARRPRPISCLLQTEYSESS